MELRHLRYFVAVAEELSFTRAAERVRVAQPSLTVQIRNLEDEIGAELFFRAKNKISLTTAGHLFLKDARRILADCDESVQAIRRAAGGELRRLTVGYSPHIFVNTLAAALKSVSREYPQLDLQIMDVCPAEQYAALQERRIDVGCVVLGPEMVGPETSSISLGKKTIVAAVPIDSPLASKPELPLASLWGSVFVAKSDKTHPGTLAWLTRVCGDAGFIPNVVREADTDSGLLTLVAAGLGVALIPESSLYVPPRGVAFIPLQGGLSVECYAVWRADNPSECLKKFIRALKDATVPCNPAFLAHVTSN